jgi:hypothetical protein
MENDVKGRNGQMRSSSYKMQALSRLEQVSKSLQLLKRYH